MTIIPQGSASLRHLPVSLFGAVMGMEGLGLAGRASAAVLPLPGWFAEFWVVIGCLALAVLLPAYLVKIVRHPQVVRDEFTHPAQLGFCATLPIALTLVGGGLAPHAMVAAQAAWWLGVGLLFAFQLWALQRWLAGGIDLAHLNAGWIIMLVGGIIVPGSGLPLGHPEVSAFFFSASAAAAPIVMGLVFYRTVAGPALPEPMRPTLFIFLAPPSLIYVHGATLSGGSGVFLDGLFFAALPLALALLIRARGLLRWPFAPSWWAFTFPLDAFALAMLRYAETHPSPVWHSLAAAVLIIAIVFVLVVLVRTVTALTLGTLFVAPQPPSAALHKP